LFLLVDVFYKDRWLVDDGGCGVAWITERMWMCVVATNLIKKGVLAEVFQASTTTPPNLDVTRRKRDK